METIWLQRSGPEIPWGFRLVGGREFGLPLSVQRVTPGSVAAAGLGAGDIILKVGNVMTSNLDHNDAMDLVKQAGNILQLTVKKTGNPPEALSPTSSYSSQNAPNYYTNSDNNTQYNTTPRGFGTGASLNNSNNTPHNFSISVNSNTPNNSSIPSYATTPRKYSTQIQLQPQQQQYQQPSRPAYNHSNSYSQDTQDVGYGFPDYTIPYRQQEPVHDSPGGPVNLGKQAQQVSPYQQSPGSAGYNPSSYNYQTLPNNTSNNNRGYRNNVGDDPNVYSSNGGDARFNTGMPYQATGNMSAPNAYHNQPNQQQPQQHQTSSPYVASSQSHDYNNYGNSNESSPGSIYTAKPVQIGYPSTPTNQGQQNTSAYTPSLQNSNIHRSGTDAYSTLPNTKPMYARNNSNSAPNNAYNYSNTMSPNNSYNNGSHTPSNIYNASPKPYTPSSLSFNASPAPFSPTSSNSPYQTSSRPYNTPLSPTGPSPSSQGAPRQRRVSFDQNTSTPPSHISNSQRIYMSPPPPPSSGEGLELSQPVYGRDIPNKPQFASISRQNSRPEDDQYSQSPYSPASGFMSPRTESLGYNGGRDQCGSPLDGRSRYASSSDGRNRYGSTSNWYDPSASVSEDFGNLSVGSPHQHELPPPPPPLPPVASAPPPPPPPPPAPPLSSWNSTPYRRGNSQRNGTNGGMYDDDEDGQQKVPDQLLNTMMQSAKGGGPKPFSYGINLSELKRKMGPPTAPKPREGSQRAASVPRGYGGYKKPVKPVGHIQKDYYVKRDYDEDPGPRRTKPPVGLMQSDYYMSRDQGPRAEIDESPINISMGTNPKKQSKSFKVLQWMTETENDEAEEETESKSAEQQQIQQKQQLMARRKDPERRHNADDDEMKFSGLHTKSDIPSKAFGRLQKMPMDSLPVAAQNGQSNVDEDEGVGNYDETSIRYKGKHIPSPSFRVLQTWAELDPDPNTTVGPTKKKEEDTDDDLPETLDSADLVDKRYKGANIPSKVFKVLQQSVGETPTDGDHVQESSTTTNGGSKPGAVAINEDVTDF